MIRKAPFQYQVCHHCTMPFKVGQKVFLKSHPHIEMEVIRIDQGLIFTNISFDGLPPEVLLQYRYAGLVVWRGKYKICWN